MRTLLTGTFTTSKMKQIFEIVNETAENFVDYFKNKNECFIEIEMKDTFTRFANDVIATTAFGLKVDSLKEPNNKFFLMGQKVTNFGKLITSLKFVVFFTAPNLYKFFRISIFARDLTEYFKNIIYETIQLREKKGIVRQDVINLLLEAKRGIKPEKQDTDEDNQRLLSNDDITSQAIIFFIAGFETISTTLGFATYELAVNKEIQEKLRVEIIETHKTNNCKLSYYSLLKMTYMDMVFSEVLRKWPPVITVDRVCTKPYTIEPARPNEKPVHLKVGDVLWLPMYPLQRDPRYYPNPEKFDPERFSSENKDKIQPYTYIPFGSGPRNCIGSRFAFLEAKAAIYNLLLNFEIVPTKRTQIPLKLAARSPLPKAERGHWLALKRL
ncbi:unnamed protein product [Ceutorhynchus assimilis]|uniref:Cytochrome P450 n=1 Tax=Ceutorhynchus assimilis TaxID=467358 RepID=A0A9P0DIR9_9CUCU|nr:unnamed protein product [Ceutorhynchus assimilis]